MGSRYMRVVCFVWWCERPWITRKRSLPCHRGTATKTGNAFFILGTSLASAESGRKLILIQGPHHLLKSSFALDAARFVSCTRQSETTSICCPTLQSEMGDMVEKRLSHFLRRTTHCYTRSRRIFAIGHHRRNDGPAKFGADSDVVDTDENSSDF